MSRSSKRGIGRPVLYGLLAIGTVIILFVGLSFQIQNVSSQFSRSLEAEMRLTAEQDFQNEFITDVPVSILTIGAEGDQLIITYWALGGLISGDQIVDLSEWRDRFDNIETRGFFLPGEYLVRVSLDDKLLNLEFSPA